MSDKPKPSFGPMGKVKTPETMSVPRRATLGLISAALEVLAANGLARDCADTNHFKGDARNVAALNGLLQAIDDILPKLPGQPTRQHLTEQGLILRDIQAERSENSFSPEARQEAAAGLKDLPSVTSGNYAPPEFPEEWCERYALPQPLTVKSWREVAFAEGRGSWSILLLENICEIVGAADDDEREARLIRAAALIVAQVESLRRRKRGTP